MTRKRGRHPSQGSELPQKSPADSHARLLPTRASWPAASLGDAGVLPGP